MRETERMGIIAIAAPYCSQLIILVLFSATRYAMMSNDGDVARTTTTDYYSATANNVR
jgi:hypothetical protein